MLTRNSFRISTLAALGLAGLTGLAFAAPPKQARAVKKPAAAKVDFSRDILPIISTKCYACHGPDEETRAVGLRLDSRAEAVKLLNGRQAIVPGKPEASRAYIRITAANPAQRMPPPKSGHEVTPREAQLVREWIRQGAPYATHWAFNTPKLPALPAVKSAGWVRNPIDRFILARLEKAGLKPAPEADRYTLIRRLSLDLTGLPPSPAEVEAFVNDKSPDAYEKLVERLLDSPHYGERWAKMWLDLARYADSAGYGSDPLRLNIWPYRDWVISAFNRNLPYDQFTVEQIAGDLLPNPTPDQLLATAFHRNTMTNTEGGTDDEEFRVAAVKDRIATTSQVWMGLTMGCAQCHTHKYDPITQREYYSFFAFFNQTEDADRPDEAPTLPLPTAAQRERTARIQSEITGLEGKLKADTPELQAELAAWEEAQAAPVQWVQPGVLEATAASGSRIQRLPDDSFLVAGNAATDTYRLQLRLPAGATALRLEALPDESLPAKGPGRGPSGAFAVTDARAALLPEAGKPLTARFIRVENPGQGRILSLAEVQVLSGGVNVAPSGKATQSSTDFEGPAQYAIDGNTDGNYPAKSTTHTRIEADPWWEVDLGKEVPISEVVVWNRLDGGTGSRLSNFRVLAYSADRKLAWETKVAEPPAPSTRLGLSGEKALPLRQASATAGSAELAIDADGKTAWAVDDPNSQVHAALWQFGAPVPEGSTVVLTLAQNAGGGKTLGRFRLSVTTTPNPPREVPPGVRAALAVDPTRRTADQRAEVLSYFRPLARALEPVRQQLAKKRTELAAVKPVDVPILRELAGDKQRTTKLLIKGNFLNPGDPVAAAVPAAFHRLPEGPANRLTLARWLVSPENPLTARVAVNRFWSQLFGRGIVETEEDFGTQGSLPSHPELLDWLAVNFSTPRKQVASTLPNAHTSARGLGWDMKALLRLIVTSATYRQSAQVDAKQEAKDPRNVLLGRFPRIRLDAEGVRDQALALSGMLSRKLGGPSVYPPQPDGLWRAAFNGQRTWPTSEGEDRYRRGIYTFWRRTVPYPSMATFDAPSREICTVRRIPTNTPLQALVTLNDPVYVELSQALARRLQREGGASPVERAGYALRLVLCRPPSEAQVQALVGLYEKELAHYRSRAEEATKLATQPIGPLPKELDPAEAAAWTVVANVLLNLDGVLARS